MHAAKVLAFDLIAGVHQRVGQLAVSGQQQQAAGVHVQTSDRDPASAGQSRQLIEYSGTTFRVVTRGKKTFGLVKAMTCAFSRWSVATTYWRPSTSTRSPLETLAPISAVSPLRLHLAVLNALLQHAARAQAGVCQHLVQTFAQGLAVVSGCVLQRQHAAIIWPAHARSSSQSAGFAWSSAGVVVGRLLVQSSVICCGVADHCSCRGAAPSRCLRSAESASL